MSIFLHMWTSCRLLVEEKTPDELVNGLVDEIDQLKRQNAELRKATKGQYKDTKHLRDQLDALKGEKREYIQGIFRLKAELDDALTRLSAVASSKLRDDNPNVVDLSDQNRPSKIAQQLSELYDNEWTNAYDVLEANMNDKECCETLLKNVMDVYKECQKLGAIDVLYERVQRCILVPAGVEYKQANRKVALSDPLKQQIQELRKSQAKLALPEVCQVILKRIHGVNQDTKEIYEYLKKCIEICWLMVVQDPPLAFSCGSTSAFDTAMFRSYTKRGDQVEFVVWPALLVQEGGALLSKGIAQGQKRQSSTSA